MRQERRPSQPPREQLPSLTSLLASQVSGIVENLERDIEEIQNPPELCRRADMAMVATLQLVAPVLPKRVKTQVQRLISLHTEFYKAALPSLKQPEQTALNEGEGEPQQPQTRRPW